MPTTTADSPEELAKFAKLRRLFDQFSFEHEAATAVQKLINEFVTITETCRSLKQGKLKLEREKIDANSQAEVLRRLVVTLTKENNQLHLDLIHNVEAREQEKWETQKVIRKHENEINAMRFVNGQYLGMAQESEGKLDSTRRGPRKSTLVEAVAGQIDLDVPLEPIPDKYDIIKQPDPRVIDIIKLYQRRLNQFDENNKTLTEREKEHQDEILGLKQQIATREQEIARLNTQLVSKRAKKLSNIFKEDEATGTSSDSRVRQLEMQTEYLHAYIINLEQDLAKLKEQQSKLLKEQEQETQSIIEELNDVKERNTLLLNNMEQHEKPVNGLKETHSDVYRLARSRGKRQSNDIATRSKYLTALNTENEQLKKDFEDVSRENQQLKDSLRKTTYQLETLTNRFLSTAERLLELGSHMQFDISPSTELIDDVNESQQQEKSVETER
ncbi:5178_t:CDS:2 [Paraglomus brasilianum]|uniref:5178_t:CDS:1 n=1 Tax=Paraglomus brasilianum TaxID=144538 RepID=A0A9N9DML8_9GLOM|nr:5178_t:CDS:2 [Paraglomus brasilianum]